jgi:predicted alpha/beta-hydrolase family hydrolase
MELRVYRSDSATAALVVGHGAGAGQNSPFMVRTAEGLAARGIAAATFDFPI